MDKKNYKRLNIINIYILDNDQINSYGMHYFKKIYKKPNNNDNQIISYLITHTIKKLNKNLARL
jgi:hypothetical protein